MEGQAGGLAPAQTTAKLVVPNLDFGVSNNDVTELFSESSSLKNPVVHCDKSGRNLHCEKNITSVVKKVKIYGFFVKCLKFFMSRFRSTGFSSKFPNFL